MMANAGPKHVRCFMYFYIKHVTVYGTIIYFNIKLLWIKMPFIKIYIDPAIIQFQPFSIDDSMKDF
jgi:hypothetical protein